MTASLLLEQLALTANGPLERAMSADPRLYRDEAVAKRETDAIFRQDWLCPGLAAEIPNPGDYITFSIAGDPIFTIRDKAGEIKTFSNVCRHRMMQLLEGKGCTSRVVCPYHAWTYDLSGKLIGAGHMERTESFDKKSICLPEVRTEIWNGWIYVTLNPDAPPVADILAPLHDVVERYGMEHYVPVVHEEHVWNTNWKLLTENFMEGYHLPVAHKATVGAWFPVEKTVFPEDVHDAFTYQTFQKVGNATYGHAHPNNERLEGNWRITSVLPTVFPTHMYVLAPDHLWYLSLRPKGVGQVDVRFGVAIAPEVDAELGYADERQAWIDDLVTFFEHVNTEDRQVVEGIFAGSAASQAAPGPLSWLEREIHDFQKYLSRRLGDGT
ncbi:aromatic ring-hydroxylating oxygenase subunit alpha [Roseovarius rhodophyticola]|uniref:SRPBCC family protein n=1 Tax=Roseovarius rhodophyticola TaxID=3080827 RepID=A0ABZ2TB41_9RHOB|nr:SRPBCC family protein [Roseovarius sp. W115]MDV2930585.1 SRPBCC family protein [Roseovarius sp. W115]